MVSPHRACCQGGRWLYLIVCHAPQLRSWQRVVYHHVVYTAVAGLHLWLLVTTCYLEVLDCAGNRDPRSGNIAYRLIFMLPRSWPSEKRRCRWRSVFFALWSGPACAPLTQSAGHSAEQRPSYLLPDRHVRGTRTPVLFRTAIMHAI